MNTPLLTVSNIHLTTDSFIIFIVDVDFFYKLSTRQKKKSRADIIYGGLTHFDRLIESRSDAFVYGFSSLIGSSASCIKRLGNEKKKKGEKEKKKGV